MADFSSRHYYFNARWYDPTLGRFITEDPIKDGINWFAYANNNPLTFIDPTGLSSVRGDYVKNREENPDIRDDSDNIFEEKYYGDLEKNYLPKDQDGNEIDNISQYIMQDENGKPYTNVKGAAFLNDDGLDVLENEGWSIEASDTFHEKDGEPVVKLTHKEGGEQVYDMMSGDLIRDEKYGGTFNKNSGPYSDLSNNIAHTALDIIPWLMMGGGRSDSSSGPERALKTVVGATNFNGSDYRNYPKGLDFNILDTSMHSFKAPMEYRNE